MKDGHPVQVIATKSALRFVGSASFEGLTDRKVFTSLWAPRESKTHISLRRWADMFIFYPATANRINQLAAGLAQDLIGATFLANNFEKPFWIAPAANTNMMLHPATQASLRTLEGWGCRIVHGDSGRLACGDTGIGRLAEPAILRGLVRQLARDTARARRTANPAVSPPRALVTGGAMTLPVDAVRSIVNTSSGRTAAAAVAALLDRGWLVSYLAHQSAATQDCEGADIVRYRTYEDFEQALGKLLAGADYDAVVHAAAVSDYFLAAGATSAKQETSSGFSLRLEPTRKLLPTVKALALAAGRRQPFVIGFKLTVHEAELDGCRRAAGYFVGGQVDRVIWNDLDGVHGDQHRFTVLAPPRPENGGDVSLEARLPQPLRRGASLAELAVAVAELAEAAVTDAAIADPTARGVGA
ncbi:MAG TPA: hypothetical protein DCX65_08840 [Spirochaetaceae bacterium]|nr:hypothetical protein [Spirochaetaceae bacterium]